MSVMTRDLALRVERSESDHFTSWSMFLRNIPENPFGIEIQRFGNCTALVNSVATLGPLFNRVLGFGETDLPLLAELVRFYTDRGLRCRIDVNPYQGTPNLFRALGLVGMQVVRFHSFLYWSSPSVPSPAGAASDEEPAIRRIDYAAGAGEWAKVWLGSFTEVMGASPNVVLPLSLATADLHQQPGWSLYLARVKKEPAAASALYIGNGVGSLAIAGTLPKFRRLGCQTALLKARLVEATNQKCDLIVAQSGLGTSSQHNMERLGMKIGYTRAFWIQP